MRVLFCVHHRTTNDSGNFPSYSASSTIWFVCHSKIFTHTKRIAPKLSLLLWPLIINNRFATLHKLSFMSISNKTTHTQQHNKWKENTKLKIPLGERTNEWKNCFNETIKQMSPFHWICLMSKKSAICSLLTSPLLRLIKEKLWYGWVWLVRALLWGLWVFLFVQLSKHNFPR